jgi:predicted nucleic acid-binding protein
MIFADLVAGDAIFVDANAFIYHFAPDPLLEPPCSQLLQRIENRELEGFTSLHLLSEVAHKLMALEASTLLGWSLTGMANRLRRYPAEVQRLTAFRRSIRANRIKSDSSAGNSAVHAGGRDGYQSAERLAHERRPDRGFDACQRPEPPRQSRRRLRPRAGPDALWAILTGRR